MVDPMSAAVGAATSAVQLAVDRYLESRESTADLNALCKSLPREYRSPVRDWYNSAISEHLLLSESEDADAQAEHSLREHIEQSGLEPLEPLAPIVTRAKEIALQRIPIVAEMRRKFKASNELIVESRNQIVAEIRGRPTAEVRDASTRTPVPIRAILARSVDSAAASRVVAIISQHPSRTGFERLASSLVDETSDYTVVEALSRYAHLRSWRGYAIELLEAAVDMSPQPERLVIRAALWSYQNDDLDRAEELLRGVAPEERGLHYRAVRSVLDNDPLELSVEALDMDDEDVDLLVLIVVDGLVRHGRGRDALSVARRWKNAHQSHVAVAVEAEIHRSLAYTGPIPSRVASLEEALRLAREARDAAHELGLPAQLATQTTVLAAAELNDFDTVVQVAEEPSSYKSLEFADAEVAAVVAFAHESRGTDGTSAEHLDPFYRRLFELVGTMSRSSPSVADLEDLLTLAQTHAQRTRALLLLAGEGHLDDEVLSQLREESPPTAAIVESRYLQATDRSERALATLRPFVDTHSAAAVQLVSILGELELREREAEAALDVWQFHGDYVFLTHAAVLMAGIEDVSDSLVERLRTSASQAQTSITDDERLAPLLESLVVIHYNRGEYERAIGYARTYHSVVHSESSRWLLATCEATLGDHRRALQTLVESDTQLPRPRSDMELRLLSILVDSQSTTAAVVGQLLEVSHDAVDADVRAIALLACERVLIRLESEIDEDIATSVWRELSQFCEDHPQSNVVRMVKIDEADPMSVFRAELPRITEVHRDLARHLLAGRMPYTMASLVTGKSPTSLLTSRGIQPLFSAANGLHIRQRERRAAGRALEEQVAVDVTTLHVLGILDEAEAVDLHAFVRAVLPTAVAQDVAAHASAPVASGSIAPTEDASLPARFIEFDERQREAVAAHQRSMDTLAARMRKRVVLPPLTIIEESIGTDGELVAWAAGELALREQLLVWADDAALRAWLRSRGVEAFGTRDLADVLMDRGLISADQHHDVRRALRREMISELSTANEIIARGRADGLSYCDSLPLRLPTWWQMAANASDDRVAELFDLVASTSPDQVAEWFGNGCVGFAMAGRTKLSGPAVLLLSLLSRVPSLQPMVDELVEAGNAFLWCVPEVLTAEEVADVLTSPAAGGSVAGAAPYVERLLGESELASAVREVLRRP